MARKQLNGNKNHDASKSLMLRRHRQMAWFLYFTKGAQANFDRALDTNSFCMTHQDVRELARLKKAQDEIVQRLEALVSG